MGLLVNIDNGGTFTDICVADGDRIIHTKTTTTPHDLTRCFTDGLRGVSQMLYGEEDLVRLLRGTDYLRYSTTSGTNALLERKGTPTGLLVADGRQDDVYGVAEFVDPGLWSAMVTGSPGPITVGADGLVDEPALIDAVNALVNQGASRIVIALPSESLEQQVKALLLERYPRHMLGAVPFLLSHELVRDTDDARRTVTAVMNAYLHPGMEHFLYGAQSVCAGNGLPAPMLIFRNDGDSARIAKTTAIKTWGSGPRGGLEGALAYARLYGTGALITMDVGGTTTDLSLVVGGRASVQARGHIENVEVSLRLPELRSMGLGGSSVITVGAGTGPAVARIVIGPESVGAAPGPACFARGGSRPTLTDALLLTGVLDPDRYLGGGIVLDRERAAAAVAAQVADPLGLSVQQAAQLIIAAFHHQVGGQIRQLIADAAVDPKEATILAFGGGGPMIATGVASAAGVRSVIVPELSAVFSAFGIGFSDLAHEYARPVATGDDQDVVLADLQARAGRDMFGEGVDPATCRYDTAVRQVRGSLIHDVPRTLAVQAVAGEELVVRAVHALPVFSLAADDPLPPTEPVPAGVREVAGDSIAVHEVDDLRPGDATSGPALIVGRLPHGRGRRRMERQSVQQFRLDSGGLSR